MYFQLQADGIKETKVLKISKLEIFDIWKNQNILRGYQKFHKVFDIFRKNAVKQRFQVPSNKRRCSRI